MTHISKARIEHRDGGQPRWTGDGQQARPGSMPARRRALLFGAALLVVAAGFAWTFGHVAAPQPASRPLATVTVSEPLRADVPTTTTFLGQFSAVDSVELRAQVGGTLTSIDFRDGQIVHKGDHLFTIDPRPYAVRLAAANAQLKTAQARQVLANVEFWRAQQLRRSNYGSAETLDQRAADLNSAQATISAAQASIDDAKLDLDYCEITAPFTGRIGSHQVSVGNLISGSRAGTSPTTLLATLVSLDPIHLDFDMSEADYLAWHAAHPNPESQGQVRISVGDDGAFTRTGTLDFIDNAVDRGSGTIHARATVANPDFALTPGQFARLSLVVSPPQPKLLVPAAAIVPDQSRETVMVVQPDGAVAQKAVVTAGLYQNLRVVSSGLAPTDRVIIDGLMLAQPGAKVHATAGKIESR